MGGLCSSGAGAARRTGGGGALSSVSRTFLLEVSGVISCISDGPRRRLVTQQLLIQPLLWLHLDFLTSASVGLVTLNVEEDYPEGVSAEGGVRPPTGPARRLSGVR